MAAEADGVDMATRDSYTVGREVRGTEMASNADATQNTDRELWREPFPDPPGDYYAPSIHVTAQGGVGINVGGLVYVMTLRNWHSLAERLSAAEARVKELEAENERLRADKERLHETWRVNVGDGTDKLTPESLSDLLSEYREELKQMRAEVKRCETQGKRRKDGEDES